MNWTNFLSSPWPYLATTALAVLVGWYVWKQPLRPGARHFRWLVLIWFVWSLFAALHNLTPSLPVRYMLWVAQGVCPLLGPPLVLMIVLEYTGNEKWLARRSLNLLFLPALLVVGLSFFPSRVSVSEVHAGVQVFRGSDLIRWGFYAYFAAVMLATLAALFACLLRAPAFWAPLWLLILGRIIPLIGYPLPNPQQLSIPPVQSGLLFLDFTIVLYFIALYSFQILRVSPVARDTVISHMPYGLLVLDAENRLVDFNAAAQTLPGMPGRLALRQSISQQMPGWWQRLSPLVGSSPVSQDVIFQDSEEQIFRVTSLPLTQAGGLRIGQAFLMESVTQARRAEQQQAQAQRVLATLQERDRLARELHDELAQELALINVQAQLAGDLLAAGQTEQARAQLQILARHARQAQVDVRGEIGKLLHGFAVGEDFPGALERFICAFRQTCGIDARFIQPQQGRPTPTFDPATEVQLLRIVQEALTNIRKHAGATKVRVALMGEPGSARLVIEDDGVGFDPQRRPTERQSYGLGIMAERAKEFNGQVVVESAPGEGTRVIVTAPTGGVRQMCAQRDEEAR